MAKVRRGFFGYWSPFLHPIRWWKVCNAHAKACNIHAYLCDQSPVNIEAVCLLDDKTWLLFDEVCDWLGT